MSEKISAAIEWLNSPALTWIWMLLLSVWGGLVNYIRKVREGESQKWSLSEIFGEIVISGFAGIITYLLCSSQGFDPLLTAAMAGISGHMGSRAIFMLENALKKRFS